MTTGHKTISKCGLMVLVICFWHIEAEHTPFARSGLRTSAVAIPKIVDFSRNEIAEFESLNLTFLSSHVSIIQVPLFGSGAIVSLPVNKENGDEESVSATDGSD
ncbi:2467_t:CDS:2 [Diversispora eburnea]|uniref:2467_t:CDS:1 n=1 Tax=Diversispora eburnea TaxID=1213867 RepID=A0A9N9FQA1_9GLOM|nr:2467_t:CDS:2 [Diversispora eburnea]